MGTYRRKSKKGKIVIVKRRDSERRKLIVGTIVGGAVLGGTLLGIAAISKGRSKEIAADRQFWDGLSRRSSMDDAAMSARHKANMQGLQNASDEAKKASAQAQYYADNPRQHPAYGEAVRDVARKLWDAGIGRKR